MCSCPPARPSPRSFWSRPMARARRSARPPASAASAGITIRPASSLRWRMSAIITAAPRSISCRLGLDPGGRDVVLRYQRWRRFDTAAMGIATDGLNRLFSNRSDALRLVRDVGLGLVERMPALKGLFIREAAGLTGDVPKLLRGEAL